MISLRVQRFATNPLLDPDSLNIYEFANTKFAEFASIAGMLYPAKGKSWVRSHHAIDENRTGFEFFNEALLFIRIISPGC